MWFEAGLAVELYGSWWHRHLCLPDVFVTSSDFEALNLERSGRQGCRKLQPHLGQKDDNKATVLRRIVSLREEDMSNPGANQLAAALHPASASCITVMIMKHIVPISCRQSDLQMHAPYLLLLRKLYCFLLSSTVALAPAFLGQNSNDAEGQPEGNKAVLQQGSSTVYISGGIPVGSPLQ